MQCWWSRCLTTFLIFTIGDGAYVINVYFSSSCSGTRDAHYTWLGNPNDLSLCNTVSTDNIIGTSPTGAKLECTGAYLVMKVYGDTACSTLQQTWTWTNNAAQVFSFPASCVQALYTAGSPSWKFQWDAGDTAHKMLSCTADVLPSAPSSSPASSCDPKVLPASCPDYWPFLPGMHRSCRYDAAACPSDHQSNIIWQTSRGFTLQTYPRISAAVGQVLALTCGNNQAAGAPAESHCSNLATGYLGTTCDRLEVGGVHSAVAGSSTASAQVQGSLPSFTLTLDVSGLNSGQQVSLCIDYEDRKSVV